PAADDRHRAPRGVSRRGQDGARHRLRLEAAEGGALLRGMRDARLGAVRLEPWAHAHSATSSCADSGALRVTTRVGGWRQLPDAATTTRWDARTKPSTTR